MIAVGLPHHVTQRGNGRRGVFHAGEPGTEHSFYSFLKWEIRDSHRKSRIHLIAPVTQELPAEWPSDAFGDNYNRNYPGIKPLFRECQGRLESHNTIDAVVRPYPSGRANACETSVFIYMENANRTDAGIQTVKVLAV